MALRIPPADLRDRRLKLLDTLFVLGGILGAVAVFKPISGYDYDYFFSLFVFSALGTYVVVLFDLNAGRGWAWVTVGKGLLVAIQATTFAAILALITAVGFTGAGPDTLPVILLLYGVTALLLFVILMYPLKPQAAIQGAAAQAAAPTGNRAPAGAPLLGVRAAIPWGVAWRTPALFAFGLCILAVFAVAALWHGVAGSIVMFLLAGSTLVLAGAIAWIERGLAVDMARYQIDEKTAMLFNYSIEAGRLAMPQGLAPQAENPNSQAYDARYWLEKAITDIKAIGRIAHERTFDQDLSMRRAEASFVSELRRNQFFNFASQIDAAFRAALGDPPS